MTEYDSAANEASATARNAMGQGIDAAKSALGSVADRAKDAYGQATDMAQTARETVEPFVQEKPYVSLTIAAAVGLLAGLLVAGRGPKVVYLRPRGD